MPIEEVALHEMLMKLAGHRSQLDEKYRNDRLVSMGLLSVEAEDFVLTPAGIELCRSLRHKLAAEVEAARVAALEG